MMTRRTRASGAPTARWLIAALLVVTACAGSTTAAPQTTSGPTPAEQDPTSVPTAEAATTPATAVTTTPTQPPVPVPTFIDNNGFNDHSVPAIGTTPEFFALARSGVSDQSVVKFTIPNMLNDTAVHWMDSNFFALHDEWYWFRLVNGQPAPASSTRPVSDLQLETIDAVYAWAEGQDPGQLPSWLRWVDSRFADKRLYATEFYNLALHSSPRNYGVGSLVHFPNSESTERDRWLIELEFTDEPTAEEIGLFFERLGPTLPTEIGSNLEWVVRSPQQEQLANEMEADELPFHDRIVRFSELVPPGEVTVYNEGIAAGRLLLVGPDDARLTDAQETDIVLVENVPDFLPPASALISSAPQTPLAHVNLLARNRGIPNASQTGLLQDAGIRQAARVRAPAVVRASGTDQLEVVLISEGEYRDWQSLLSKDQIAVPPTDLSDAPTVLALDALANDVDTEADIEAWRPVIGGKSAGFLTLLAAEGVTTPQNPLAITARPYAEHLESVKPALDAMLADSDFKSSSRARFLFLEGPADYGLTFTTEADGDLADRILDDIPRGALLGSILDAGGFMRYFRDAPMRRSTLASVVDALEAAYGDYNDGQGIRFRSSSSVEDIEGFSGAGLYDSNTGFLEPERQDDEKDQKKSVERALKKTWSSYWSFEAYEERELENVDHLSGAMGVLVHARFDDALELNNGVATLTLGPPGRPTTARINVQEGDVSVTNPDPTSGGLPEVIAATESARLEIERVAASTIATEGPVFSDAAVRELFEQLQATALLWRSRVNASLPTEQRIETLTLDFEFKTMAAGWPAFDDDRSLEASRLVVKQARSLDPGLRGIPQDVLRLPVPRDVLARARLITRVDCPGSPETVEILTDPLLVPDVGYAESPYIVDGSVNSTNTDCNRRVVFSTPDQFLIELLATNDQLNLTG